MRAYAHGAWETLNYVVLGDGMIYAEVLSALDLLLLTSVVDNRREIMRLKARARAGRLEGGLEAGGHGGSARVNMH